MIIFQIINYEDSTFSNNSPLIDPNQLDLMVLNPYTVGLPILDLPSVRGGVFWLETANILIENCFFVNNTAKIGGVAYLFSHFSSKNSIINISNSSFILNAAGPTAGVLYFGQYIMIQAEISSCNFISNRAKRIFINAFFLFLKL